MKMMTSDSRLSRCRWTGRGHERRKESWRSKVVVSELASVRRRRWRTNFLGESQMMKHTRITDNYNYNKLLLVGLITLMLMKQPLPSRSQGLMLPESSNQQINSVSVQQSAILLDTTEQSALGWTKYPDGSPGTRTPGWVEESFTNFERGINWRSFVVCDVAFNSVNNWLWTPFIERGSANRLYIEIKFTMRDCNLFPQRVLSCKETFALLYKEMDAPVELGNANASFAQSPDYSLIDAIAADEGRFTSNTDVVINTEIRSIPVSKRGIYFAFRDQGACLSLISIRVYHLTCPQLVSQLAHFPATPTGRDLTSMATVAGQCVPNALPVGALDSAPGPRMICTADGQWAGLGGVPACRCAPGFEPAANYTRCAPCSPASAQGARCRPDWAGPSVLDTPVAPNDFGGSNLNSMPPLSPPAGIQSPIFEDLGPPLSIQQQQQQQFGAPSAGAAPSSRFPPGPSSSSSSSSSFALLLLLGALLAIGLLSVGLIHYRRSLILGRSLGSLGSAGFGHLGNSSSSTYGGVYGPARNIFGPANSGSSASSSAAATAGLLQSPLHVNQQQQQQQLHQATLSAASAGGLITGANYQQHHTGTGRSCTGNAVQNFIAATLSQISGNKQQQHQQGKQQLFSNVATTLTASHQQHQQVTAANQQTRNHYHQTLGVATLGQQQQQHTMLSHQHQQRPAHLLQQQHPSPASFTSTENNNNNNSNSATLGQQHNNPDALKYRTLTSQHGTAQFLLQHQQQQQDPQLHIYDDLDNTTCSTAAASPEATVAAALTSVGSPVAGKRRNINTEIEPQRVAIETILSRGEFGDVCLARLKSPLTGAESRVACKTLKSHSNERAKLDFLIEASIMSQFQHENIIHLEGVVTRSEPFMILTEFMENGALDSYLRENKNRFTCLQLISMLRGIASGMEYLAKLNYVHKDLAARNILVSDQNVCKIADFGLSAQQSGWTFSQQQQDPSAGEYTNAQFASTTSSNTLSSQTSPGSSPSTGSTLASAQTSLQQLADQLAEQRFLQNQQQQQQQQQPLVGDTQNHKIPVRWTALESIAFRRFTGASDVWSFGVVCWEVMTEGERPYWNWSNQDVIRALEQGYRLPQPEGCPEHLYKLMLDCWLKERTARPTFSQIVRALERLLNSASTYEDPFPCHSFKCTPLSAQQAAQLVGMQTQVQLQPARISNQEPAYYDTYNPISQLISTNKSANHQQNLDQPQQQQTVDEWLNSIKMSRYKENFQRHQIYSLQYVSRLSHADLNLIGIQNNQHIKKILTAIMALRSASSIGTSGEGYLV